MSKTHDENCVCKHTADTEASQQCLVTSVFGGAPMPWGALLEGRADGRQERQGCVRDLRFHLHRKEPVTRQELQSALHLW